MRADCWTVQYASMIRNHRQLRDDWDARVEDPSLITVSICACAVPVTLILAYSTVYTVPLHLKFNVTNFVQVLFLSLALVCGFRGKYFNKQTTTTYRTGYNWQYIMNSVLFQSIWLECSQRSNDGNSVPCHHTYRNYVLIQSQWSFCAVSTF